MKKSYSILYLEDSPEDVELCSETLRREYIPCEVSWVNGREAFASALAGGWSFDLIFADFSLPDILGEEALALARGSCPNVPFIFLSGSMGEEMAVEYLRNGATDYVLKTNLSRLAPVVRRALEEARASAARREAEAATSRVVSLLRATLESTAEGILVVDLAGKITTYNRKFMSLCGIPDYVMAPMEMDRVLQFLLDQFQDPETFLAEAKLLGAHPDRESFGMINLKGSNTEKKVLEEYSRPHRVANQTVGRVYTFSDVTARERSAGLLKDLAQSRLNLLEATGAGGVVPWCLTEDSLLLAESAESVLGLGPGKFPRDLSELEALIHPEELDRFREALERPRKACFDLRLRKGGALWIWTRWSLTRDPASGYRGIFMDITDQKRSEEALAEQRRSQGMAALADSNVRALKGLLQDTMERLLSLGVAGSLNGAQEEHLLHASYTLDRIDDCLTQTALATRCEPDTSSRLRPRVLAEEIGGWASSTLGAGVELKIQVDPGFPDLAMGAQHLREILRNLLRNARDAVMGSGAVSLRFSDGKGSGLCSALDGFAVVEVQDAGPGIPPGIQSRMFESFFTTRQDATGLGLAVVRSIVESYKGFIHVETAQGRGTTFRLLLPTAGMDQGGVRDQGLELARELSI